DPRELFTIEAKLGEGAFGAVYRGRFKMTGFVLAIKEIRIDHVTDTAAVEREIHLLKQLHHPNTVQYFGCCFVDQCIWILNSYCGAGSILDCMTLRDAPLTEAQCAIVTADALNGLAYLHEEGIIHRDLKCSNILLTLSGQIMIADFGVSERLAPDAAASGAVVGSPYWMSPEVIRGAAAGLAADIWSLGITVIEMIDGMPPLAEMPPMRAMFKIPFLPEPSVREPARVSAALLAFVHACIRKEPQDRADAESLKQLAFVS
ncbi:hypothetical protein CXG81DRAFT_5595, partial [Caulochytrium protostelioides]